MAKRKEYPNTLLVTLMNQGNSDEYFQVSRTANDFRCDDFADGDRIAVYQLVEVRTLVKRCELPLNTKTTRTA